MDLQRRPRLLPILLLTGSLLLGAIAGSCSGGPRDSRSPSSAGGDPPGARRATLEELLRDRAAARHPADGGGRAWIEPADGPHPEAIVASGRGRWTIVYEAGPLGIAEGGAVRLIVSPFWDWSFPQIARPQRLGYTTVTTGAPGVRLELSVLSYLDIRIRGRGLKEGERLRIVYGAGEALARADRFAERGERFRIGVDGDGDRVHRLIQDAPSIDVRAAPPSQLQVLLPGTARPGETVPLRVVLLDRAANAGFPFLGSVELMSSPAWEGVPSKLDFEPRHRGARVIQLRAQEAGVYRVTARVTGKGDRARADLVATSNPLLVDATGPRVLWGDLHGHSAWSDGSGTPEDYLYYAREIAGLDVVALTDHDHWGFEFLDEHPERWEAIGEQVERFDEPGRFVALRGYEWTNWIHGHRHVLHFASQGELLSSLDPGCDTPALLWESLRGQRALTLAHHSAGGPVSTNWAYAPDPELEPLTEIASVHGSSEAPDTPFPIYGAVSGNWVRDVLDRGYRFGFVGSGDSHDGHPGLAHLASGQGGLAAILAPERTREEVYAALRTRRAYATNGPRILLRAALAGRPMGSELEAPAPHRPALLYVRVIACSPLQRVDVIRRGAVERSVPGEGTLNSSHEFLLEALQAGEYVYVRAVQEDGGAAWSSPFFVR